MKTRSIEAELFHAERRTDEQTNRHDESNSRCLPPWVKLNTARHTTIHFWEVTNMWDFTLPPTWSWGLRPSGLLCNVDC